MNCQMNTPWHRYALIAELALRLGQEQRWFGKTALQKMVFLLQEVEGVDCGYDFDLYTHGPFTSKLLGDLDLSESLRAVRVKYRSEAGFKGYQISVGDENESIRAKAQDFLNTNKKHIEKVLEDFGRFGAKDLELRATILYLDRRIKIGGRTVAREELVDLVKKIKPRFSRETILTALSELEHKRYIHHKAQ